MLSLSIRSLQWLRNNFDIRCFGRSGLPEIKQAARSTLQLHLVQFGQKIETQRWVDGHRVDAILGPFRLHRGAEFLRLAPRLADRAGRLADHGRRGRVALRRRSQCWSGTTFSLFLPLRGGWRIAAGRVNPEDQSYLGQPNACIVEFRPPSSQLFLLDDAGVNWLGPVTLGSSATLQNSACSLNAAASSFSGNGNTLQVNVALSFKPGFGSAGGREPRKAVCLYAKDNAGAGEEQSCLGLWIPEAPTPALIARHRLYNPYNYAHFYTASENERNVLVSRGFIPENPIPGMGYNQPNTVSGIPTQPFYRILYFPANGAASFHYWTDPVLRHFRPVSPIQKNHQAGR